MMHISSCSCLCTRIVMMCHFSKLQAFVTTAPDWSLMFTHPAGKAENYHDESRSCPTPKDPEMDAQSWQPHCFCMRQLESAFCPFRCLLITLRGPRLVHFLSQEKESWPDCLFSAVFTLNTHTLWPTEHLNEKFLTLNFIFYTLTSVGCDLTLSTCFYRNWLLFLSPSTSYSRKAEPIHILGKELQSEHWKEKIDHG